MSAQPLSATMERGDCGQRQNPPNVQEAEHRGLSQPRGSVVGDGHPSPLKKRKEGKFTN